MVENLFIFTKKKIQWQRTFQRLVGICVTFLRYQIKENIHSRNILIPLQVAAGHRWIQNWNLIKFHNIPWVKNNGETWIIA